MCFGNPTIHSPTRHRCPEPRFAQPDLLKTRRAALDDSRIGCIHISGRLYRT